MPVPQNPQTVTSIRLWNSWMYLPVKSSRDINQPALFHIPLCENSFSLKLNPCGQPLKTQKTIQSRTGGVLGTVPSAAVMGACRIFFYGGGKIHGCKNVTFLVVTLRTQVFTVTTNAQNTLQHFHGASAPKNVSFFRRGGACVRRRGEGRQSKRV